MRGAREWLGEGPWEGRCKAHSRSGGGEQCKRTVVPGKQVCRFHGGHLRGPEKGQQNALKLGLYARYLPKLSEGELEFLETGPDDDVLRGLMTEVRLLRLLIARYLKSEPEAGELVRQVGMAGERLATMIKTHYLVSGRGEDELTRALAAVVGAAKARIRAGVDVEVD